MSYLKDKPLKKCHTDKRQMIDDLHHQLLETMDKEETISYYLENGILLDEYYKNSNNGSVLSNSESNGILNYFQEDVTEDKQSVE